MTYIRKRPRKMPPDAVTSYRCSCCGGSITIDPLNQHMQTCPLCDASIVDQQRASDKRVRNMRNLP